MKSNTLIKHMTSNHQADQGNVRKESESEDDIFNDSVKETGKETIMMKNSFVFSKSTLHEFKP